MVKVQIKDKEFYLDGNLKERLDNLKHIVYRKNWDGIFIVDGHERVGKSTLALTCAYYLSEGNFTVDNVCADSNDVIKKIENFPDKSVLLVDEGSMVFNSKDAMKKEQRKLMKIINVVGQKNMIFIIVLPSIFDLNKQIAVRRSKFLLHCYADEQLNRGRFVYFGEDAKKVLYSVGKKNYDSYSYPKRSQNDYGVYTDFNPLGDEYLLTKKKSLLSSLHEELKDERGVRSRIIEGIVQYIELYPFKEKMTQKQKGEMIGVSEVTYRRYVKKIKESGKKIENS